MTISPDTHSPDESPNNVAENKPKPTVNWRLIRRSMVIGGAFAMLFGVYILAFLIPDMIKSLAGPEDLAIEQAGDVASSSPTYAVIEGGVWQCDTIKYIKGVSTSSLQTSRPQIVIKYTEIFLTDKANLPDVVMLVTESDEKSCEDFQNTTLDGYLKRMSSDTQQELANEVRLARFPGATTYLEMCSYCGPENSAIGTGFGVVALVGGGFLVIRGRRIRVNRDDDAQADG